MRKRIAITLLIIIALQASCRVPESAPTATPEPISADMIITAVAQTLAAAQSVSTVTATTAPAEATVTATTPATSTATPTNTLVATNTPLPCNRGSFVEDVTIPDNKEIEPNTDFTKTWRLRNNGSCTWTSGYVAFFDHGDRMNAPDTVQLTGGTVAPGATVDVSITMRSPASQGTYQGFFKLRSPDNIVFGINTSGQDAFWVKIVVPAPEVAALPDLRITGMSFSADPPTMGVPFVVTVLVKNKGEAAAGAFSVQWWSSHALVACNWNLSSLAVNEERTLTCTYTYASWSTYTVKGVADPANNVVESDEANNIREDSYLVQH
jgi:hypothetical protein